MVRSTHSFMSSVRSPLQWSHVFSDMVSSMADLPIGLMRMLQWSHVFSYMVRSVTGVLEDFPAMVASMEPCLFRHGKRSQQGHGPSMIGRLQWSHVFSDMVRIMVDEHPPQSAEASMEPCLFRHGKPLAAAPRSERLRELQWSHVFSDMVRHLTRMLLDVLGEASMEPCLFRHGKMNTSPITERGYHRFNGAMSFQTW